MQGVMRHGAIGGHLALRNSRETPSSPTRTLGNSRGDGRRIGERTSATGPELWRRIWGMPNRTCVARKKTIDAMRSRGGTGKRTARLLLRRTPGSGVTSRCVGGWGVGGGWSVLFTTRIGRRRPVVFGYAISFRLYRSWIPSMAYPYLNASIISAR